MRLILILTALYLVASQEPHPQITKLPRFSRPILQVHDPFKPWKNDHAMLCFEEALLEYNIDFKLEFVPLANDFKPLHYDPRPLSQSLRIEEHKQRDSALENVAWAFGRFLPQKCDEFVVRDGMPRNVDRLIERLQRESTGTRNFTVLAEPVITGDLKRFRMLLCAEQVAHALDDIARTGSMKQALDEASKYGHWYLHAIGAAAEECKREEEAFRAMEGSMFWGTPRSKFRGDPSVWKPFLIGKVWEQYDYGCMLTRDSDSFKV